MSHYRSMKNLHTQRLERYVLGVGLQYSKERIGDLFKIQQVFIRYVLIEDINRWSQRKGFTLIDSFACWQERKVPLFTARRPFSTNTSQYGK